DEVKDFLTLALSPEGEREGRNPPPPGGRGQGEVAWLRALQRTQEVQHVLLVRLAEIPEVVDDRVGFRARTPVRQDGGQQIGGSSVVEEENALAEAPQRGRPELGGTGAALNDVVREARPQVVDEQIREQVDVPVPERGDGRVACRERRRVTQR